MQLRKVYNLLLLVASILTSNSGFAQDVQYSRRVSQNEVISKTIGNTKITIDYHSPLAKGRKIFGGIVPYDFVVDGKEYAWRAGSNQRTIIEFTHNVTINGSALKAGKYGLVILVSELDWTFVFTNDFSWGAFQYEKSQDVLRVKVPTKKAEHSEWLHYKFENPKPDATELTLHWAETSATINISTDVSKNIVKDVLKKDELSFTDYIILISEYRTQRKKDSAYYYLKIANKKQNDTVVKRHEKFSFNILKSKVLIDNNKTTEGEQLLEETLKTSKEFDIYYYGLNELLINNNKEKALKILSENIEKNPENWQGYLALGEYYLKTDNPVKVVENFKKAYEKAPDNWKNYTRYLYLQNKIILNQN